MVKEILCALLEHGYTQCTYSPQEIFGQQNNALAVQDTTSTDPVNCPLCLVDKHFIDPIPGQEGGRRKHLSGASFVCNVSKEALSDAGLGDSYKPKKFTSYWCSICKLALWVDPCFRLYHTEKDYTSEILKIARTSVKPIQKDVQNVQTDAQHV